MNHILKAHVTEKSLLLAEKGMYTFEVDKYVNKPIIEAEIKRLFNVTPIGVRILVIKGKVKTRGKFSGKRSDVRKAIVKIKDGQKIKEFSVGE